MTSKINFQFKKINISVISDYRPGTPIHARVR